MEDTKNEYKILVGKPIIPGRGCEDNIRMDLREIVWEGVDWMHLA